jgi:hypothetical protein
MPLFVEFDFAAAAPEVSSNFVVKPIPFGRRFSR